MTKIILTVIGIAMVAVTSLVIIFYGGGALSEGEERAEASRLLNEGANLEHALELYYFAEGGYPASGGDSSAAVAELVGKEYLSSVPEGMRERIDGDWAIDYSEGMIKASVGSETDEKAMGICREARRQLSLPDPEKVYLCDGSDSPGGVLSRIEPCCIRR